VLLMGIPGFYRWIADKCRNSIEYIDDDFNIDCLYIDLNGAFHINSQKSELQSPIEVKQIFRDTKKYLQNILSNCKPNLRLYLALDGVAPRAKINQQRARRFTKVKEVNEFHNELLEAKELWENLNLKGPKAIYKPWNSNQITPGTQFMQQANKFVHDFAYDYALHNPNVEVIVSDSSVAGEGEHKIMDWIRKEDEDVSHGVMGNDSDLYLLCALSKMKKIFIVRKDQQKANATVQTVNIELMREGWLLQVGAPTKCSPDEKKSYIVDMVFMLSIVGNDFLPSLITTCLHSTRGVIDAITKAYRRMRSDGGNFVTNGTTVNYESLNSILRIMEKNENFIAKKIARKFNNRGKPFQKKFAGKANPRKDRRRKKKNENKSPETSIIINPPTKCEFQKNADSSRKAKSLSTERSPVILNQLSETSENDKKENELRATAKEFVPQPPKSTTLKPEAPEFKPKFVTSDQPSAPVSSELKPDAPEFKPRKDSKTSANSELKADAPEFKPTTESAQTNSTEKKQPAPEDQESLPTSVTSELKADAAEFKPMETESTQTKSTEPSLDEKVPKVEKSPVLLQLEYYLSDRNLSQDAFTVNVMRKNGSKSVPIIMFLSFMRMKELGATEDLIREEIKKSDFLILDDNGHVMRIDQVGSAEFSDAPSLRYDDRQLEYSRRSFEKLKGNDKGFKYNLGEENWQDEYYKKCLNITENSAKEKVTSEYFKGMAWVLDYYLNGISDWNWFYPYHYSPTLSELIKVTPEEQFKFGKTEPFTPSLQLLSVFPACDHIYLPLSLQQVHNAENLKDTHWPEKFDSDTSGCWKEWQGKTLLPFVDREKLEKAVEECDQRTPEEKKLDEQGKDMVYLCQAKMLKYEYGKRPMGIWPFAAAGFLGGLVLMKYLQQK